MTDQQPTTGKNIVLLSDGTGNRGGKGHGTNVWRTYLAIDRHLPGDREQLAFYDDGVGSEDFKLFRTLGGAFGWGLSRNIRELYTALARNYVVGDSIYLFGFSRGAYTVRLLAGLIARFGVIDYRKLDGPDALEALVDQAYTLYHRGSPGERAAFRQQHALDEATRIRFVGVWDTVDALGVPFDGLRKGLDRLFRYRFGDQQLSAVVDKGCHALSIDDARTTFHPVLWDERSEEAAEGAEPRIEQLWFSGMHSDVGGGNAKGQLAMISLGWMWAKASACGLRLDQDACLRHGHEADATGKLHDSRAGLAGFYRYGPRLLGPQCDGGGVATVRLHDSVLQRVQHSSDHYVPANVPSQFSDETGEPIQLADCSAEVGGVVRQLHWLYRLMLLTTVSAVLFAGAPLLLDLWRGDFSALWRWVADDPASSLAILGGHTAALVLLTRQRQKMKRELRRLGNQMWRGLRR